MKFFRPAGLRANTSYGGSADPFGAGGLWYSPGGFLAGAMPNRSGSDLALTLSSFWKATRILSENFASFAFQVHERLNPGPAHRALPRSPLTWSLGHQPSPVLDAFAHWETTMVHLVHRGNSYAFKKYLPTPLGPGLQLDLIHPDRVRVSRRPDRTVDYGVRDSAGTYQSFGVADVFHLRGMGSDGLCGLDMIQYAASSLSGDLAAENYAHRFFKQGAMAGVAAIPERDIGPVGSQNLAQSVRSYLTGLENAHSVFVPTDKITLQTLGYDAEKAQILLTRQFTVEQIAHWFNLPPGMLGDSKTPTFASSQQFRQDLVDLCFRPWVERLEARIDVDLLQYADEDPLRYFGVFDMDALLRGNAIERSQIHQRNILAGWETRNEARLAENMEPIDGLDEPILPVNVGGATSSGATPMQQNNNVDRMWPDHGSPIMVSMREAALIIQESTRLVRKEMAAAGKAAQRFASDGPGWQAWLREFYGPHAQEVAERLRMPLPVAKEFCARQGLRLASRGIGTLEQWESTVVAELSDLAVSPRLEAAAAVLEETAA